MSVPVAPVYNQLSTIRNDLIQGQAFGASNIGVTGVENNLVNMILNPAPPPNPFANSSLYESSLYGERLDVGANMRAHYEESMQRSSSDERHFDMAWGVATSAMFMIPQLMPVGLAMSLGSGVAKDFARNVGIISRPDPVFNFEDMVRGNISSQIHRTAFANLDPFATGGERGISIADAREIGDEMFDFMRAEGFQGLEMGRLTQGAAMAGTFTGASDIKQITGRLKDYIETISQFVRETGASLEEAGQVAAIGNRMGVPFGSGMSDFMRTVSTGANVGGISALNFMQMGGAIAEPLMQSGLDLSPVMSAFAWDTAQLRTLSSAGMVSQIAMQQVGGSAAAAANLNQMGINYWMSPQNYRTAAAMSMDGEWDRAALRGIIAGQGPGDGFMNDYNNADINARLRAQWHARENIVNNADLAAEAMLGSTFARLDEMGIDDPLAQRQQLVNWGFTPAQAEVSASYYASIGDPGLQVRAYNRSFELQAETFVQNLQEKARVNLRHMLQAGAVSRGGSHGDARRLAEGYDGDYGMWAQAAQFDQTGSTQYLNNSLGIETLASGNRSELNLAFGEMALEGMNAAERDIYGPQIAGILNQRDWRRNIGFGTLTDAQGSALGTLAGVGETFAGISTMGVTTAANWAWGALAGRSGPADRLLGRDEDLDLDIRWEDGQFRYYSGGIDVTDRIASGDLNVYSRGDLTGFLREVENINPANLVADQMGLGSRAVEQLIPTVGQATILQRAYGYSENLRGAVDDIGGEILSGARQAMEERAVVDRLIERRDISYHMDRMTGSDFDPRLRELYERLVTSGESFTGGLTPGSVEAPLALANRVAGHLFDNASFSEISETSQDDVLSLIGVLYSDYATRSEDLRAEAVRNEAKVLEKFTGSARVESRMVSQDIDYHRKNIIERISGRLGIDESEITDEFLSHVSYVAYAALANMSPEEAVAELGLSGQMARDVGQAFRELYGYYGWGVEEMAEFLGHGDHASQLAFVRSALEDVTKHIMVGGENLTDDQIGQLLRGEKIEGMHWREGAPDETTRLFSELIEKGELTEALLETLLKEESDAVPGGEQGFVLPEGTFEVQGDVHLTATNVYVGGDTVPGSGNSIPTGAAESSGSAALGALGGVRM